MNVIKHIPANCPPLLRRFVMSVLGTIGSWRWYEDSTPVLIHLYKVSAAIEYTVKNTANDEHSIFCRRLLPIAIHVNGSCIERWRWNRMSDSVWTFFSFSHLLSSCRPLPLTVLSFFFGDNLFKFKAMGTKPMSKFVEKEYTRKYSLVSQSIAL